MPRDTPPPIPKEILDQWYAKRRARQNVNQEPLGEKRTIEQRGRPAPAFEAKTVYEARPIVRDLKKEAVSAFMPTTVRMKLDKGQGAGGLLEPEEADRLEQEGYLGAPDRPGEAIHPTHNTTSTEEQDGPRTVTVEDVDDEQG